MNEGIRSILEIINKVQKKDISLREKCMVPGSNTFFGSIVNNEF